MALRARPLISGEYYHVFNRGNNKQDICLDDSDRNRLVFLMMCMQSKAPVPNIKRHVDNFVHSGSLALDSGLVSLLLNSRYVQLVNFVLMPNHFHATVTASSDTGISEYLHKFQMAYSKYFNLKHSRVGHLFQGTFKSVHIGDENQLQYVSAYIHRNPRDLTGWKDREHEYAWSSYQDYVGENRWGSLLKKEIIVEGFSSGTDYRLFVESSGAKELDDELCLDAEGCSTLSVEHS